MFDFILEVLRVTAKADLHDSLWWRVDGEYSPVTFFINCNDLFDWGTADCERITPENLTVLKQAIADVRAVSPHQSALYADELFCARVRGERPQGACYRTIPEHLHAMFDACGPAREKSILNPVGR